MKGIEHLFEGTYIEMFNCIFIFMRRSYAVIIFNSVNLYDIFQITYYY